MAVKNMFLGPGVAQGIEQVTWGQICPEAVYIRSSQMVNCSPQLTCLSKAKNPPSKNDILFKILKDPIFFYFFSLKF